jgi:hypothetical protein
MPYIPSEPVPEPAGDIRAQLAAVLDPAHPKRACYMVPADVERLDLKALPRGAFAATRPEGTLVTTEIKLAARFDASPLEPEAFDRAMAEILDYPEAKPDIADRCQGNAKLARTVQARDAAGHVVTEAATSAMRFLDTCAALQAHVPPGGQLVIMSPAAAISRRVAMRWIDD